MFCASIVVECICFLVSNKKAVTVENRFGRLFQRFLLVQLFSSGQRDIMGETRGAEGRGWIAAYAYVAFLIEMGGVGGRQPCVED